MRNNKTTNPPYNVMTWNLSLDQFMLKLHCIMCVFVLIDWIETDGDLALIEPTYHFLGENLGEIRGKTPKRTKEWLPGKFQFQAQHNTEALMHRRHPTVTAPQASVWFLNINIVHSKKVSFCSNMRVKFDLIIDTTHFWAYIGVWNFE